MVTLGEGQEFVRAFDRNHAALQDSVNRLLTAAEDGVVEGYSRSELLRDRGVTTILEATDLGIALENASLQQREGQGED